MRAPDGRAGRSERAGRSLRAGRSPLAGRSVRGPRSDFSPVGAPPRSFEPGRLEERFESLRSPSRRSPSRRPPRPLGAYVTTTSGPDAGFTIISSFSLRGSSGEAVFGGRTEMTSIPSM